MNTPRHDSPTSEHLARAVEGDAESLAWIVARLSPLLLAHAEFRLGQRLRAACDPEDLVADAWLAALPRLSEIGVSRRRTPALLRFLSVIVVRRISDLARKQLRVQRPVSQLDKNEPSVELSVITEVLRREDADRVAMALRLLGARDREIVILRAIEQVANHTVARMLGMKADTVSKRFQRALAELRRRLPDSGFDDLSNYGE